MTSVWVLAYNNGRIGNEDNMRAVARALSLDNWHIIIPGLETPDHPVPSRVYPDIFLISALSVESGSVSADNIRLADTFRKYILDQARRERHPITTIAVHPPSAPIVRLDPSRDIDIEIVGGPQVQMEQGRTNPHLRRVTYDTLIPSVWTPKDITNVHSVSDGPLPADIAKICIGRYVYSLFLGGDVDQATLRKISDKIRQNHTGGNAQEPAILISTGPRTPNSTGNIHLLMDDIFDGIAHYTYVFQPNDPNNPMPYMMAFGRTHFVTADSMTTLSQVGATSAEIVLFGQNTAPLRGSATDKIEIVRLFAESALASPDLGYITLDRYCAGDIPPLRVPFNSADQLAANVHAMIASMSNEYASDQRISQGRHPLEVPFFAP